MDETNALGIILDMHSRGLIAEGCLEKAFAYARTRGAEIFREHAHMTKLKCMQAVLEGGYEKGA